MNSWLYVGIGLIIASLAELIWAAKTKAPAHISAQALVFGELGLMALSIALIADELAATVVVAMLGLGGLVSVWLQVKLVREWKARSSR